MFLKLGNLTFILVLLTSFSILLLRNWRPNVITLAVQYLGIFFLVAINWPLGMAIIKLVVGWMICTVLGITSMTIKNLDETEDRRLLSSYFFRGFGGLLIILIIFALIPQIQSIFPPKIPQPIIKASVTLIGLGLLQLGMTSKPFYVIIGLLTVLSGFEILHSALEISSLLAGLLAGVNLGLALVGVYFLSKENDEVST